MKQPKKDQTLEAVKAQGKKTEVALKAASLRQEKAITRAVKAGSKETASSVGKMTKSLKGTMNAGLSEIASSIANQPTPPTAMQIAEAMVAAMAAQQPQPAPVQKNNRGLIIGMIVAGVVFIALLIAACWFTATLVSKKVDGQVTEINQVRQEILNMQTTVQAQSQSDRDNLIKAVSEVVNAKVAAQSQAVPEAVKTLMVKQASELQSSTEEQKNQIAALTKAVEGLVAIANNSNKTIRDLETNLENEKRGNEQSKQFYDERIAAVMGLVKAAKTETSKQPESVVAAPVSETRNEQPSMVGASAGSFKDSEEVVLDEKSSWNGAVKLGWRSNGLRENGTTSSDGSVMTADARVSWKNLYVNVGMMKGDNLNDEQNVAVGYEWKNFDFSTGFEKRPNGNRLFIGAAMDYPVWDIGRGGLFSIVASGKYLMYTDDLVSSNREITKSGYEFGAGIKHEISLAKWWDLTSQLGLMHQSGYDQVWRVSPWGKGWPYNIDASTVGYIKVGSKFGITRNIDFNVDLLGTSTLGKTKFVKNGFESSFGVSLDIDVWNMFRRR